MVGGRSPLSRYVDHRIDGSGEDVLDTRLTDTLIEWNVWGQFTAESMQMALKLDSLDSSHPIDVPIYSAMEVEQVTDDITYLKVSSNLSKAQHGQLNSLRISLRPSFA